MGGYSGFNFAAPASGTMATPGGGSNINPTGANSFGGTTTPWGGGMSIYGAPTGSSGNYGYGASANPNPSIYGGNFGAPTTSMFPGATSTSFGGGTTGAAPGSGSVYGGTYAPVTGGGGKGSATNAQLNNPLGSGLGPQVQTFLNSNAGYNSPLTQQSVAAQIQAMQSQIQRGYGNLESGLGAAGISPNSSAAALETGDYMANAVAQENAITAQEFFNMWDQSMNRETTMLGDVITPSAQRQQQQYTSPYQWASLAVNAASDVVGMNPGGIFSAFN